MKDVNFPIVETFGYQWDATSEAAENAFGQKWCRFSDTECEKYRQYRFGYCSVQYAAAGDGGVAQTYAVCDHRLDGPPVERAMRDHFGDREWHLVPEIVLTAPRTSFDYVGLPKDGRDDVVVVETQSVDIRGGGVGPAWRAWQDGSVGSWRKYFTQEAASKGRKDNVAYGVNLANIYKRLGLQVADKGGFLKQIGVPLYVVMQDRCFDYLVKRIPFVASDRDWDICFMTFDYGPVMSEDGSLELEHRRTVRTSLESYVTALSADQRMSKSARADFLDRVKRKAGLG